MAGFLTRDLVGSMRFKEKLKRKEITTLINTSHPSASLVERLGELQFDAILIEAEHGSVGRERVEDMSRGAALAKVCALIRPESSLPHLITGYLGCGVDGFMLPLVRDAGHAQELVDAFRLSAPLDYPKRPLILMIERLEAVEALPAILAIEGIDAFLVAPWDMALSMGVDFTKTDTVIPAATHAVVDRAIKTIVDADRVCGMSVGFNNVEMYLEKGVRLIYGHADHMIAEGSKSFMKLLRSHVPEV